MSLTEEICIGELARMVQGDLQLGDMPPLGGAWEPIGRCVAGRDEFQPGDVVFIGQQSDDAEGELLTPTECFARGALGVITDNDVQPWDGRFAIRVEDASAALWELASCARSRFSGRTIAVVQTEASSASHVIEGALTQRLSGSACRPRRLSDAVADLIKPHRIDDFSMLVWTSPSDHDTYQLSELWRPDIVVVDGPPTNSHGHHDWTNGCQDGAGFLEDAAGWSESLDLSGTLVLCGDHDCLSELACSCEAEPISVGRQITNELPVQRIKRHGETLSFEIAGQRIVASNVDESDITSLGFAYVVLRRMGMDESSAARLASNWNVTHQRSRRAA